MSGITQDQDEAILSAYLGIQVLCNMCRRAGLSAGYKRSRDLLKELDAAFPGLASRASLRMIKDPTP